MDWFTRLYDVKSLLLTILIFVPLERLLPRNPEQKIFRANWQIDVIYLLCNSWIIRIGLAVVILGVTAAGQWLVPADFQRAAGRQNIWVQLLEIILLSDLLFYGVHRLFHTVPFLWRFHAVHHSIEQMDWLAGNRVHPVDQILTKGASIAPCFILGFSPLAVAIYFALYYWHSVLLHSNVQLSLGPLKYLIATPYFHHWHHSREPEALDKNFGAQLVILDLLFGTAYMPKQQWTPSYGVNEPMPQTYPDQILYPFRQPSIRTATGVPS